MPCRRCAAASAGEGVTEHVWESGGATPYPAIDCDHAVDAVIIGAGFSGLVAAIEARAAGLSVIVLEAAQPGAGASGVNAGHFAPMMLGNSSIAKVRKSLGAARGDAWLRMIAGSGGWLIAAIERHGIACALRTPYLCVARSDAGVAKMRAMFEGWQAYGGRFEMVGRAALDTHVASARYHGGAWLPEGGTLDPLRLVRGLASAAAETGVAVYGDSRVLTAVAGKGGWTLSTAQARIRARRLLVATGATGPGLFPAAEDALPHMTAATIATAPLADDSASILPSGGSLVDLDDKAVFSPTVTDDGRLVASVLCSAAEPTLPAAAQPFLRRFRQAFPGRDLPLFERISSGRMTITGDGVPRLYRLGSDGWALSGCNGFGLTHGICAAREAARLLAGAVEGDIVLPVTVPRPLAGRGLANLMIRRLMVPMLNGVVG
jgi:glycine/D-amino acid oxidase-like deaminating enzyme